MIGVLMNEIRRPTPEELEECLRQPSQVVQTAAGPVEYANAARVRRSSRSMAVRGAMTRG